MKKRVLSFFLALTVLLSIPFQCMTSFAGQSGKLCLKEPYDTIRFSCNDNYLAYGSSDIFLLFTHINYNASTGTSENEYYLYCLDDYYNLGRLYVHVGHEPQYTNLYLIDHTENNITSCYSQYTNSGIYYVYDIGQSNNYCLSDYNIKNFNGSHLNDMRFDFLHNDSFPYYHSSDSNGTLHFTWGLLASNVDIYDYNGNVVQYGNYYTLMQYFNDTLPKDQVKDYSGHETAPGVEVTEPTEATHPSDYVDDPVEVSNNILTNIKNIFKSLADLPKKIGDLILDGLKALFVPSDNLFLDIIDMVKSKFGFVDQILDIADFIIHYDFEESPPDSSVEFRRGDGLEWGTFTSQIMDWGIIEPYRELIRNLILAVTWFFFIRKLQKRLPDIINGVSSGGDA